MMTRNARTLAMLVAVTLCIAPSSAAAYVGPGSGVTVIGAALALIGGVFLVIAGFIWYPIKRLLRLRRRKEPHTAADTAAQ